MLIAAKNTYAAAPGRADLMTEYLAGRRRRVLAIVDVATAACVLLVPSVLTTKYAGIGVPSWQSLIFLVSSLISVALFSSEALRTASKITFFLLATFISISIGLLLRPFGGMSYDYHMYADISYLLAFAAGFIANLSIDEQCLKNRYRIFVVACVCNAIVGVVQHFAADSFYEDLVTENMRQGLIFRSTGLIGHPLLLGTLLGSCAILLCSTAGRRVIENAGLRYVAALICVAGLVATLNISTVVSLAIGLVAVVAVNTSTGSHVLKRRMGRAVGIAVFAAAAVLCLPRGTFDIPALDDLAARVDSFGDSDSRQIRESALRAFPTNISHHPQVAFFGAGPGAETIDLAERVYEMDIPFSTFDNSYLTILWNLGLLGFLGFGSLLLIPYRGKSVRQRPWRVFPLTLFFLVQVFVFSFLASASMMLVATLVFCIPHRAEMWSDDGDPVV